MSLVLDALAHWAAVKPEATALKSSTQGWSWARLAAEVERVSGILRERLPADGAVAILMDNSPAFVVADLALIALQRATLPLPLFFTETQRRSACQSAGVRAILHDGEGIIVAGQDVTLSALPAPPVELHKGTAKVTFTSGSTGDPKGVCLSQAQMEATAASLVRVLGTDLAGVHMPVLPLSVLLENVAGLYPILLAGGVYHVAGLAEIGFAQAFAPDFGLLTAKIAEARATSLILVPEILRGVLAAKAATGRELPDLAFVAVGGAKVAPELLHAARAAGVPAYEGYGLSECGSVVALNSPQADQEGSVGRVLPHLCVEIEDGEIIAGPSPFLGYVGGEPQSGPVRTGDLGALGPDGFLSVSGRKSNRIITSYGRNISPEWVESQLLAQAEIGQAMVFGEAQPALGALISPSRAGLPPAALQAAIDRANAALPQYAQVRRWRAAPPFDPAKGEVTANGRPRRAVLAETYADFIRSPDEAACPSSPA